MDAETSVIARKLRNFYVVENHPTAKMPKRTRPAARRMETYERATEPSYLKNLLSVILMGAAVYLTEMSLILIKWVKKLEE